VKVYLRTFGCRANHYDSEAVRAMVEANGHAIVSRAADADVAVFNSCAVTSEAEAELRKVVRRSARDRVGLRSVVMGCAAALDEARPAAFRVASLPSVESVVAGADLDAIAGALGLAERPLAARTSRQAGARALLRVQDGCDEHCTFCATTLARGANRSRPIDELLGEATTLADRHPEIVITGIHIGTYGADRGSSLGELMERLVADVPVVRFRLSSIEATELDDRLVALLAGAPDRLAPHVHAPLQSGSDRVLKRMGRRWYTSSSYAASIERLASRMPILGLGADVIAGFPGETAEDHAATMRLVDELPFTYLHVFPYSARPGTAADRLRDSVHPAAITERAAQLREVGRRKAATYAAARAGGLADVVVVGSGAKREGVTGDYLDVRIADPSFVRGDRFAARLLADGDSLCAVAAPESAGAGGGGRLQRVTSSGHD
jgi:threonylcarbamoyladenosine tRNA methylthiotransferase MtaB